ncbi:hypothetical protein ACCO45_010789 [Purpureocillium lilacinum]|uniref:Uncharacterized protein n=1 Tax=Purpureocillium lilacinum TaxID=33203 RepID=A0ACC4DIF9_PURLI
MASLPRGVSAGAQLNLDHGDCIAATGPRRPRLLRSSITEPSITTHNALRGSLVNPASPEKAAEMLSKAWIYPVARQVIGSNGSSERLRQPAPVTVPRREQLHTVAHAGKYGIHDLLDESQSGRWRDDCYFSFPNFDQWAVPEPRSAKDEPN